MDDYGYLTIKNPAVRSKSVAFVSMMVEHAYKIGVGGEG